MGAWHMKLKKLIEELNFTNLDIDGDDIELDAINPLNQATSNQLSFLDNKKYLKELLCTQAAAVFVHPDLESNVPEQTIAIVCEEPYVALARASKFFAPKLYELEGEPARLGKNTNVQEHVCIGKNIIIGDNCTLMSGVVIGDNVKIGNNTIVYSNVSIYRDCELGSDCIIHAGTVIGCDGFGFAMGKNGEYTKIYQNGNVVIGNNVEIGGNCAIDRAAFASTIIGDNVRIDNLVHIAHNCIIGKNSILAGQVGLAGSVTLGEKVMMGGQSGVTGHVTVAAFTTLAGRAVATKTVKESGFYAGFPLMPHRMWLKLQGKIQRLLK